MTEPFRTVLTRPDGRKCTVVIPDREEEAPIEQVNATLRHELANIIRCFDRDNVPTRQRGHDDNSSVDVSINCRTAERIRELLK